MIIDLNCSYMNAYKLLLSVKNITYKMRLYEKNAVCPKKACPNSYSNLLHKKGHVFYGIHYVCIQNALYINYIICLQNANARCSPMVL